MNKPIIDAIKEYDKSFNPDILYDLEKYNQYNEKVDGEIIRIRTFIKEFLSTWQKTDKITGDAAVLIVLSTYANESKLLKEKVYTIRQNVLTNSSHAKAIVDELRSISTSFTATDSEKVSRLMNEINQYVNDIKKFHTEIESQHTLLNQLIEKVKNQSFDIQELASLMLKIREIAANAETIADNVYKKKEVINVLKEKQVENEELIKKHREQNILKYINESNLLKTKLETIKQLTNKNFEEANAAAKELLIIAISFTQHEKKQVNTLVIELTKSMTTVMDLYKELEKQHILLEQSSDIRELEPLMMKIREIAVKVTANADDVNKKKENIIVLKEKQSGIEKAILARQAEAKAKAEAEAIRQAEVNAKAEADAEAARQVEAAQQAEMARQIKKHREQNIPKYINELNLLKEKVKNLIPFVHSSFSEAKTSADALLRIALSFTQRDKETVNTLVSEINTLMIKANELYKEIEEQHKLVEQSHTREELEALMVKIREIAVKAETNANDVYKKTAYIKMWENDQPRVEEANRKDREQTIKDNAKVEAARAQGELYAQEKHDEYDDDTSKSSWWGWGGHRIKKNSHKSIRKNNIKKYSIKKNIVIKRKSLCKSLPYKYKSIKKVR